MSYTVVNSGIGSYTPCFSLNSVSGHKYGAVLGYKRVTAVIKNIEKSRNRFVGFQLFVDFTTLKTPGPF